MDETLLNPLFITARQKLTVCPSTTSSSPSLLSHIKRFMESGYGGRLTYGHKIQRMASNESTGDTERHRQSSGLNAGSRGEVGTRTAEETLGPEIGRLELQRQKREPGKLQRN